MTARHVAMAAAGVALGVSVALLVLLADPQVYPYGWAALVDALAAYRLTRLVAADELARPLRAAVIRRAYLAADYDPEVLTDTLDEMVDADMDADPSSVPRLAYLVRCRWCTGVYVAAAVVLGRCCWPALWAPLAAVLALAAVAVLLARAEDG